MGARLHIKGGRRYNLEGAYSKKLRAKKYKEMKILPGWYDIAQICLNGHVVNDSVNAYPQHNKKFCDRCGAETITICPNCKSNIQGEYHVEGVPVLGHYKAPAFCHNCGKPFPWTERKIQAAKELAQEIENLSNDDKDILTQSIDDLVKDTPGAMLAATRFKKIVSKTSKPVVDAFRDILIEIISESTRKFIFGG
jgi:hypothetical protein